MQPPVVKDNSQIVAPVVTTVVKSGKWSHWLFLAPIYMVLILVGASLTSWVSEYSTESNDDESNDGDSNSDSDSSCRPKNKLYEFLVKSTVRKNCEKTPFY